MIKGGNDYDYFFEVDGERRYDFDAAFGPTDLYNFSAPVDEDREEVGSPSVGGIIIPTQIIIANSISICSPPTVSSASSSSSRSSGSSSPSKVVEYSGPVVVWPSKVPEMMWIKPMPSDYEFIAFEKSAIFRGTCCTTTTTTTYQAYNYGNLHHHSNQQHLLKGKLGKPTTKRVHFNERPSVVVFDIVC